MSLENIILSERRQTRKATYLRFHLYEMTELGNSIGTESRLVVVRACEGEEGNAE